MNLIKVLVENQNGILVTTSNRVAQELGVRHDNLLVKIEEYLSKFNSPEVSGQFYIPSNYKASNGRMVKNYLITEKGIAQLIGGYSAAVPKAFELNVAYINEFERMKNLIKNNMQKPMSIPEQLLMNAQWMVEAENRINNVENEVAETRENIGVMQKEINRIEHNERRTITSNHLTVIAYANMKGINPGSYNSSSVGRKATKLCRDRGLLTGTVVDSKYGLINTYPIEVLDEIFFG
jgi:phage regulatory protein, rha family|nr:MAG TPA: regulatory protein [Caudoviricetes sp.]